MTHTPGPWVANGRCVTANSTIGTHHDQVEIDAYGAPLVCESICTLDNARLIAAAPDLLAVLIELVGQRDAHFHTITAWDAARVAIAKATGQ